MTECEAYRRFNREQRILQRWRKIANDIERLRHDMETAFAAGDEAVVSKMLANPRYVNTVQTFMSCRGYSKSLEGWRLACGTDLGLFKRTRKLGWDRLWRILREVNRKGST